MKALHLGSTLAVPVPGRAVGLLLALVVLIVMTVLALAPLTLGSGTRQSAAPTSAPPTTTEVNCWDSPVC
jgi:hypothetical protein